jgi:hypothetical protein
MNTTPNPDHTKLAAQFLAIAANAMTDDDTPGVDWLDDRDVSIVHLIATAYAMAEAVDTRDDFADGLVSGRLCLVVDREGVHLVERAPAA